MQAVLSDASAFAKRPQALITQLKRNARSAFSNQPTFKENEILSNVHLDLTCQYLAA